MERSNTETESIGSPEHMCIRNCSCFLPVVASCSLWRKVLSRHRPMNQTWLYLFALPTTMNTVRKGHKRRRWEIEIYVRKEVDSRTIVCSIAGGYLCVVVVIFRCCLYSPFLLRTALIQLPSLRLLLLSLIDDAAALLFFSDVATCPNGCELFQVLCCTGSFRLFGLASRLLCLLFTPSSASLLNSTYCFVTWVGGAAPRPLPGVLIVRTVFFAVTT